jgi:hypothetical protein
VESERLDGFDVDQKLSRTANACRMAGSVEETAVRWLMRHAAAQVTGPGVNSVKSL